MVTRSSLGTRVLHISVWRMLSNKVTLYIPFIIILCPNPKLHMSYYVYQISEILHPVLSVCCRLYP